MMKVWDENGLVMMCWPNRVDIMTCEIGITFIAPSFVMLFVMFVMVLYCLCIVGNLRPFFVKKVIRINNPYDPYGLKND